MIKNIFKYYNIAHSAMELIQNKSIGLVTNQTGVDGNGKPNYERFMALDDVALKIIFSPEHGLFGEAAAGEKVQYNGQMKSIIWPFFSLLAVNNLVLFK